MLTLRPQNISQLVELWTPTLCWFTSLSWLYTKCSCLATTLFTWQLDDILDTIKIESYNYHTRNRSYRAPPPFQWRKRLAVQISGFQLKDLPSSTQNIINSKNGKKYSRQIWYKVKVDWIYRRIILNNRTRKSNLSKTHDQWHNKVMRDGRSASRNRIFFIHGVDNLFFPSFRVGNSFHVVTHWDNKLRV